MTVVIRLAATALAAYCVFAVIYRMSPEGLDLDLPDVTAEQHRILQRLAWRTVGAYAYSGIAPSADAVSGAPRP